MFMIPIQMLLLFFQRFSWLAGIHDFWFLQFQPELLTSLIINSQCFDYSAVVFFRAHRPEDVTEEEYSTVVKMLAIDDNNSGWN